MRYHSLDAWRGLACLLVVVFHSTFYASHEWDFAPTDPANWLITASERLWLGVSMFFVISGYCITATVESAHRKNLPVSDYLSRRVRRIFPPYLICFVLSAVAVGGLDVLCPGLFADDNHEIIRPWWLNAWQLAGNLTLTEGWRPHLVGGRGYWFMGHAWTLGYEEQFYAVTGILLLLAGRHFYAAVIFVTAAVLAGMTWAGRGFFFDGHWLFFAAGILVFYVVNYRHSFWLCLPLVAGVVWCLMLPGELTNEGANWRQFSLVAYSFALLLVILHPWDKQIASRAGWLSTAGLWTYSIYLVHWPICKGLSHALFDAGLRSPTATVLVTVPLCLAASVLGGWLFHIAVERRFLNAPVK
jgi:peptidoglycan/LPS O-acetylase OafA/YrhL